MSAKSQRCPKCGEAMSRRLGEFECGACGYTEPTGALQDAAPGSGAGRHGATRIAGAPSHSSIPGSWNYAPPFAQSGRGDARSAADSPETAASTSNVGWLVIVGLVWAFTIYSYAHFYLYMHFPYDVYPATVINTALGCPTWILLIGMPYMVGLAFWHASMGRAGKSTGWSVLIALGLVFWSGASLLLYYALGYNGGERYFSPIWAIVGSIALLIQLLHWGSILFNRTERYTSGLRAIAVPAFYICLALSVPSLLAAFSIQNETTESHAVSQRLSAIRNQEYEKVMHAVGFVEYPNMEKSTYQTGESANSNGEKWLEIQFHTNDSVADVLSFYEPLVKQAGLTVHRAYYKKTGMPVSNNEGLLAWNESSKTAFTLWIYDLHEGPGLIQVQVSISINIADDFVSHLSKFYVFSD